MPGQFITFEGGEGGGKSTQIRMLADWLTERGVDVILSREPGGTPLGEKIRELLLHEMETPLCPEAEAYLFAAGRAQHVREKIRPALAAGSWVISDRFLDSSLAYQGIGRGLGLDTVREINATAIDGLRPDLTVLLDLDGDLSAARIADRAPDRIESEADSFHSRTRATFRELAIAEPDRFLRLNADDTIEGIATRIRDEIDRRMFSE